MTGLTLLLTLVACGGSAGAEAPVQGTSGPSGPSDPGDPPAPSGPAGATGSTGASGPLPTLRLERLDPSAECDGLVPDRAPAPIDVHLSPPAGATCGAALADGTGRVAIAARTGDATRWQVFRPDGSAAGAFSAAALVPEPSGWHGLDVAAGASGPLVSQLRLSPDGAPLGTSPASADPGHLRSDLWVLAQDPRGGSFTLVGETDLFHNHFTTLEAQRFDASGAPRWPENLRLAGNGDHSFQFLGAGVSTQGECLALWQHSADVDVLWVDRAGATAAAETRAERADGVIGSASYRAYRLELAPLLDGGLALRADGTFQRTYPRLATRSAPLPGWLAARAGWTYRFTRGNRGYALFPPAGEPQPTCDRAIELLAPSGRLCGRVTLRGAGAPCTSGAVDQGWDGTVVQQRVKDGCDYRFWPGLLAR